MKKIEYYKRMIIKLIFLVIVCMQFSCNYKTKDNKDKFLLSSDIGRLNYRKCVIASIKEMDSTFTLYDLLKKSDSLYKIENEKTAKNIYDEKN